VVDFFLRNSTKLDCLYLVPFSRVMPYLISLSWSMGFRNFLISCPGFCFSLSEFVSINLVILSLWFLLKCLDKSLHVLKG
jgi:hypothetical protein